MPNAAEPTHLTQPAIAADRATRRGAVASAGVQLSYEVSGSGAPTLTLLPGWMIADSATWAAQVGALSDRFRVVTYDSRGTGRSGRPAAPGDYQVPALVRDAVAVLDATGTQRTVLVGNSLGGLIAYLVAAQHSDRVAGLVLIGATIDLAGAGPSPLQRAVATFDDELPASGTHAPDRGWARYNRHAWRRDYRGFVEWFVRTALGPEATGPMLVAGLAQGLDVGPDVLAATVVSRQAADPAPMLRRLAGHINCPTLVINGDRDEICPPGWSRALAHTLGAARHSVRGGGHCPHITRATEINKLITAFASEITT